MAEDLMRYDLLAQEALRGVVRAALRKVVKSGLPGEHHFYIAFDTRFPGVQLSERLNQKYPNEMTIVIQHQYWNLTVSDAGFEVELSFDNIPEKLVIPFNAVKGFLDPHVQFGLQFEAMAADEVKIPEPKKPAKELSLAAEEPAGVAGDEKNEAPQEEPAKIVSLDSFRKK
ncbi:SspB family protein [soil metagenome]